MYVALRAAARDSVPAVFQPPTRLGRLNDRPRLLADRTQRLKDARGEANKEIEQLRAKKDDEFRQFEDQVCGIPGVPHTSSNDTGKLSPQAGEH